MTISFEPMTVAHIAGAVALSRQVDWPHRPEDWELNRSISSGVVGLAEGRVVASIFMTPYGADAATINMVIVDEAMRGLGLGRRLMDQGLALAGGRACSLVATQAGLPLYEKLGFVAVGQVVQHQGEAPAVAIPDAVDWAEAGDHRRIAALDRSAYGHDRSRLLYALAKRAKFAVIRDDEEVQGFAAIRDFGRGQVIGPVVARSDTEARVLVDFLLAHNEGRFVRIDTRDEADLTSFLLERGLARVGGGIAMRRGLPQPSAGASGHHRTYALASQALG
jgi:GNAT superfamily N-acetyltransferase